MSLSLSVYLSVCLSVCLCLSLCVCLYLYLCLCISVSVCVCLSPTVRVGLCRVSLDLLASVTSHSPSPLFISILCLSAFVCSCMTLSFFVCLSVSLFLSVCLCYLFHLSFSSISLSFPSVSLSFPILSLSIGLSACLSLYHLHCSNDVFPLGSFRVYVSIIYIHKCDTHTHTRVHLCTSACI